MDIAQARKLWAHVNPHLPALGDDKQASIVLHHARTQAGNVPLKLRAYSHRWLVDGGYPSGLPDTLKPRAERMYPRFASTVGISVGSPFPAVVTAVSGAMEGAVLEAEADGKLEDSRFVKARMMEARAYQHKKLFG